VDEAETTANKKQGPKAMTDEQEGRMEQVGGGQEVWIMDYEVWVYRGGI
jgi:hypothetical protein